MAAPAVVVVTMAVVVVVAEGEVVTARVVLVAPLLVFMQPEDSWGAATKNNASSALSTIDNLISGAKPSRRRGA